MPSAYRGHVGRLPEITCVRPNNSSKTAEYERADDDKHHPEYPVEHLGRPDPWYIGIETEALQHTPDVHRETDRDEWTRVGTEVLR